ncbi:MAG: hypothetical protein OEY33_08415 [Bdellovibrionales bacterium]|jgi:hypothetical protein|nr:hypothetical protein [Bdellovibrionales bacterium]
MRLSQALKEKLMDIRLRDKFLESGKITKAQEQEYLNSLNDDSLKAVQVKKEDSANRE